MGPERGWRARRRAEERRTKEKSLYARRYQTSRQSSTFSSGFDADTPPVRKIVFQIAPLLRTTYRYPPYVDVAKGSSERVLIVWAQLRRDGGLNSLTPFARGRGNVEAKRWFINIACYQPSFYRPSFYNCIIVIAKIRQVSTRVYAENEAISRFYCESYYNHNTASARNLYKAITFPSFSTCPAAFF